MLVASVGATMATELGLATAFGDESEERLNFGSLEPLVALMQDTPPEKLQAILVDKIKAGSDLKTLVSAGTLANARSFGGQDYIGFHTIMAMMPAWKMSQRMPKETAALPVLKVLFRNTERIQEFGGSKAEVLKPITAKPLPAEGGGERLQAAIRSGDMSQTEKTFYGLSQGAPIDAFNSLQYVVQENMNVHRVVLAWRAWDTLNLTGQEHAHTLLRQSVRFCTEREKGIRDKAALTRVRTILPKLLDQYKLLERKLGTKRGGDEWIAELTAAIFNGTSEQAAEAAAAALADGYAPREIGEAISMAANQMVLHDVGRTRPADFKGHSGRPIGSVHGDSLGVHASDAANAWRNIAAVSNHRNTVASLIVGAYHTASRAQGVSRDPYPFADQQETLRSLNAAGLLAEAERAIQRQDQGGAAAAVALYGQLGSSAQPVFDMLLKYAVSEDGALHAEKYFTTVTEEFANSRAKYRWNHLIALARVTASEFGWPAPGHLDAIQRLKG
jgi:hypothetical protein